MSLLRWIFLRRNVGALLIAWLVAGTAFAAGTLSIPTVDNYDVRVGTQTFAALYKFTTNTALVEKRRRR